MPVHKREFSAETWKEIREEITQTWKNISIEELEKIERTSKALATLLKKKYGFTEENAYELLENILAHVNVKRPRRGRDSASHHVDRIP